MLKPQVWLVAFFAAFFASYLLLLRDEGPRWGAWRRAEHLRVVDLQLDGLRDLLREYRARHGRYPTLEEGLSVLDGYATRFPTGHDPEMLRGALFDSYPTGLLKRIRWYREENGTFPECVEELAELFWLPLEPPQPPIPESEAAEVAFAPNGAFYILHRGEVLTGWGLPFIYENRRDASGRVGPSALGDLDAGVPGVRYARKVDEGVYVSSLEARFVESELRKYERIIQFRVFGCMAAILLSGVLFLVSLVVTFARSRGRRLRLLGGVSILGAGLGAAFVVGVMAAESTRFTCYATVFFSRWLDREHIPACEALLEKYRASGTIRAETYERLRRAFEEERKRVESPGC